MLLKATTFFYCLGKYKISISYKSKVLLHFYIKKYKIKYMPLKIFLRQPSEALMSKFYLPNLNLEYHLCRWAKKIDGSTVALAIFLPLSWISNYMNGNLSSSKGITFFSCIHKQVYFHLFNCSTSICCYSIAIPRNI